MVVEDILLLILQMYVQALQLIIMYLKACSDTNVEKVIFSSSACVYPTDLQKDVGSKL